MKKNKYLILVDTLYTAFYRFFATLKWYSFSNPESYAEIKNISNYDWLNNKIFLEKYKKMFMESIIKIIKKKIFNNSNIIFCMDSLTDLWRNKLLSSYKSNRPDLSLKFNFKPVFDYTFKYLLPDLNNKYNNTFTIYCDNIEADDIIAIITNYIYNIKTDIVIYIISGDNDFLQLGRNNLYFINYKSKKIFQISTEEAKYNLLKKIIFGDKSDNISSIIPKNFKINNQELLNNSSYLNNFLDENPVIKKKFILNSKIIDFNLIPKKYNKNVIKLFNNL